MIAFMIVCCLLFVVGSLTLALLALGEIFDPAPQRRPTMRTGHTDRRYCKHHRTNCQTFGNHHKETQQ